MLSLYSRKRTILPIRIICAKSLLKNDCVLSTCHLQNKTQTRTHARAHMHTCVCVCVSARARVRARVRVCVRACVRGACGACGAWCVLETQYGGVVLSVVI